MVLRPRAGSYAGDVTVQLDRIAASAARVDAAPAHAPVEVVPVVVIRRSWRMPMVSARACRLLAVVPVLAYATCVAVQPVPLGPSPVLPWWYGVVDIASLVALIVACIGLGRARGWAPTAVVVAGAGMIAETITCPASGHHQVLGWWWYLQWGLSAAVLLGGLLLRRAYPRPH